MNRLVGCCVALFLFGCVTRGLREHDLEAHGLTALVLEPGQELDWPDVAGLGPAVRYAYDPDRGFASGRGATLGAGNRPATCVSWQQAAQYCRWIGGRLPTEAEWERAARGRKERAYPWSDATGEEPVDCDHANHFACGERLLPVDAPLLGRSPDGIAHLAGNAAEWVSDYYGPYRRGSNPRGPRAPSTTARAA